MDTDFSSVARTQEALQQEQNKNDRKGSVEEFSSDAFMELMLAQLKHQDPTSPAKTEDMMAQMAQFSSAAGIKELKETATEMMGSLQSNQALQASSLVGRSVLVPGQTAYRSEGGTIAGTVELPASTTNLQVDVFDGTGQRVRQLNLGPRAAGGATFTWDGRADDGTELPAGDYSIAAHAPIEGKSESLDTAVYADVESVSLGGSGASPTLNLAGSGSVNLSQVREIR